MELTNTNAKILPRISGIYLLRHGVTGDTYVGSAANLRERLCGWASAVKCGKLPKRFRDVCRSSGSEFTASILETVDSIERHNAERRWIEKLKPTLNKMRVPSRNPSEARFPVNLNLHTDLLKRLDEFIASQSIRYTRGAIVAAAIREFLEREQHPARKPPAR